MYFYGIFRSVKRDILAFGVADLGGTPIYSSLGEEIGLKDPNLISPALVGIFFLIQEVSGEKELLVLGRSPAIIILKGERTFLWTLARKAYPKFIKMLKTKLKRIEEEASEETLELFGREELERRIHEILSF